MRTGRGMGKRAKASLARNRSSKSIKPHKASMLTCLRCRVTWLLTMSNFDLWTLAICWRTLIYHSARYKCLAPHCGNKNSKLRFQRTRRWIKEWTANSNRIRLTYFTGKEKTTVWDLGILLPQLCLPCEAGIWKVLLRAQSALCIDTI